MYELNPRMRYDALTVVSFGTWRCVV